MVFVSIDRRECDFQSLLINFSPAPYNINITFYPTKFIAENIGEKACSFLRYEQNTCQIIQVTHYFRYEYTFEHMNGSGCEYEPGTINDALAQVIANYFNRRDSIIEENDLARDKERERMRLHYLLRGF